MDEKLARLSATIPQEIETPTQDRSEERTTNQPTAIQQWGVIFSRQVNVPEDFEFPLNVGLQGLWNLWCCGNTVAGIPAFRHMDGKTHFKGRRRPQQRLSEIKSLMLPLESYLLKEGEWKEKPTSVEAVDMFAIAYAAVYGDCRPRLCIHASRKRRRSARYL